jgi:hypothetical protein
MNDEGFTDIDELVLIQASQLYRLRAAFTDALNGLLKATGLCEPGYRVPADCLHRLLVWHAEKAREALERIGNVC